MEKSSEIAKRRISFECWLDRIDMILSLGGHRIRDLNDVPWKSIYESGLKAGDVASALIDALGKQPKMMRIK